MLFRSHECSSRRTIRCVRFEEANAGWGAVPLVVVFNPLPSSVCHNSFRRLIIILSARCMSRSRIRALLRGASGRRFRHTAARNRLAHVEKDFSSGMTDRPSRRTFMVVYILSGETVPIENHPNSPPSLRLFSNGSLGSSGCPTIRTISLFITRPKEMP